MATGMKAVPAWARDVFLVGAGATVAALALHGAGLLGGKGRGEAGGGEAGGGGEPAASGLGRATWWTAAEQPTGTRARGLSDASRKQARAVSGHA